MISFVVIVDGKYSEWSRWEDCSVTCGQGTRTRTRECNSPPPQFGGQPCEGEPTDKLVCVEPPCSGNQKECAQHNSRTIHFVKRMISRMIDFTIFFSLSLILSNQNYFDTIIDLVFRQNILFIDYSERCLLSLGTMDAMLCYL